jgi:hypothetical protein
MRIHSSLFSLLYLRHLFLLSSSLCCILSFVHHLLAICLFHSIHPSSSPLLLFPPRHCLSSFLVLPHDIPICTLYIFSIFPQLRSSTHLSTRPSISNYLTFFLLNPLRFNIILHFCRFNYIFFAYARPFVSFLLCFSSGSHFLCLSIFFFVPFGCSSFLHPPIPPSTEKSLVSPFFHSISTVHPLL